MVDIEARRRRNREAQARYRKSEKGQSKIKAYRRSEASKATKARWRANSKYKAAAHRLVFTAVEAGILIREPCEVCQAEVVHAHHDDYAKPLDVRWLCPLHHKAVHP